MLSHHCGVIIKALKHFSISDIEGLTGIKAHTIRIWEQRYNLLSAKRTATNIRYYDDEDLRLFLNISTLNQHGYKISKISKMDADEIFQLVKTLQAQPKNTDAQLKKLLNAMIKMDETTFEQTLQKCVKELGLEEAMINVIFPFLYKVGEMWQVGTINAAHEHFASHKIQQKIINATYQIKAKTTESSKKYILFLPPQEQHELGLLFAQYLLRKYGQHCLYLGQSLPFETLKEVSMYYKPDFAFTVLTSALADKKIDDTVSSLQSSLSDVTLLITGNQVSHYQGKNTKRFQVITNIQSFINHIKK